MTRLTFEWDPAKSRTNLAKHGVRFEEALTVFYDENARLLSDPDHSDDEERFLLLGLSSSPRILVVCHCVRDERRVIRLISARKATRNERGQYGG